MAGVHPSGLDERTNREVVAVDIVDNLIDEFLRELIHRLASTAQRGCAVLTVGPGINFVSDPRKDEKA